MYRTWIVSLLFVVVASDSFSLKAQSLVTRQGTYIKLTTDLESESEVDRLVESFDAAVPQWLAFFNLDGVDDWKVDAYVVRDKARFRQLGLLPNHIPDFPFGYAHGNSIWVLTQQSEYYTRHLLLHEGVHALSFSLFGDAGPPWFMEGMAELLATHNDSGEQIVVEHVPENRESVPYWGRFKLMSQLREQNKIPNIKTVMEYRGRLTGDVDVYGWSWAATMLLSRYPKYRVALIEAARKADQHQGNFNRNFFELIGSKEWPIMLARWRMMCHDLDYGFDWAEERIELSATYPAWRGNSIQLDVNSQNGWQSPQVRFTPGTKLSIDAGGEIVLAHDPKPWVSQPPGVTIEYNSGRPLGQLLVCILPTAGSPGQFVAPLKVLPVESSTELTLKQHCWLLFRVNDRLGDRGNNQGSYQVSVTPKR